MFGWLVLGFLVHTLALVVIVVVVVVVVVF